MLLFLKLRESVRKPLRIAKSICISILLFLCCASQAFGANFTRSSGRYYTISHTVEVSNPSNDTITNIEVKVPLADDTSTSWQDYIGEQLQPQPDQILTNETGGRVAVYQIPQLAPGQTVTLKQLFAVENFAVDFTINAADISVYQGGVANRYLQPEEGIESNDPLIVDYASKVAAGETNPYTIARLLFSDIGLKLTYDADYDGEYSAVQALLSKQGDCNQYVYLFVASLRALGVPARWCSGYLYLPQEHSAAPYLTANGNLNGDEMRHIWAEVYLPNCGWIVVDPTYSYTAVIGGTSQKLVDWDKFAHIGRDERHIMLNEGSNVVDKIQYTYDSATAAPSVDFHAELIPLLMISPFQDTRNHWAEDSILALSSMSPPILQGIEENYFGVSENLTRAQLVTIINRVFGYEASGASSFTDVASTHWAAGEIATAARLGYINGYPDGTFHPEEAVSRGALAEILRKAANLPAADTAESPFVDLEQPGWGWAKDSILSLYAAGLTAGVTADTYQPQKSLSRAEGAVFIYRFMQSQYYEK